MKRILTIIAAVMAFGTVAQAQEECFAIAVGRAASADGSVIYGHNEDDRGEQLINMYVTQPQPAPSARDYGKQTAKYLWAELAGMEVADAFLNEYGVCIVSDNCKSREDKPELIDGGVLYEIRLNVARYAHTAREGVKIIGDLVERYGYNQSGRTYVIADTREAWFVVVVYGRHWAAARVPDDEVALMSNFYTVTKVDLEDTDNYAGSADIIQYAVERGWYDPIHDGEFSFRKAYASKGSITSEHNIKRLNRALKHMTGKDYGLDPLKYPFSVKPAHGPVDVADAIKVLSLHYDFGSESHHGDRTCICNDNTVLSTIFHLRGNMPLDLGCIMWTAMGHPCSEAFIPWYLGISKAPKHFARFGNNWKKAELKHFDGTKSYRKSFPKVRYWDYVRRWEALKTDESLYQHRRESVAAFQQKLFDAQPSFEKECQNLSGKQLTKKLDNYLKNCYKAYEKTWKD